jgi:hypothetical protein
VGRQRDVDVGRDRNRVAAVAAFEEATVAAVADDLVDADTLDILGATWDQIASSSAIPSPGALSSIAATAPGGDRSPMQVAILAGVVLVCAFVGFAFGSYTGLIAVFIGVGVVGALMRGSSRPAP